MYKLVFISSTFSFKLTSIHSFVSRICENKCRITLKNSGPRNNDNLTTSEEVGTTIIQGNIMALVEMTIGVKGLANLGVDVGNIDFSRFY